MICEARFKFNLFGIRWCLFQSISFLRILPRDESALYHTAEVYLDSVLELSAFSSGNRNVYMCISLVGSISKVMQV